MYAVGRIGSYISRGVYSVSGPFHPFGGAVDIIVVEQPDGSFKSSPWYVRFGKFQGVLKTKEKVVSIHVNGVDANFNMYLNHKGEAYFLKEVDVEQGESVLYPSSSGDETDGQFGSNKSPMKSKSYNCDADKLNSADRIAVSNEKIVARTGSRRARILGLVFGRKSIKDNYQEGEGDIGVARLSSLERAEIAADLLEVKWSTNVASSKSRKDNVSRISAHDVMDDKVANDMQVNDQEPHVDLSAQNDRQNGDDHSLLDEETGFPSEQMASSSHLSSENLESSVEEASAKISSIDTVEQALESSTMDESMLEENSETISEMSRTIDDFGIGNAYHDDGQEQTCPDSKIQYELQACCGKQVDEEQACDKRDVAFSGCRISTETGPDRVQSFACCETSESSIVGLDGGNEKTQELLHLASGGCVEVHVHLETLYVADELQPKVADVEQAEDIELEKESEAVFQNHCDQVKPSHCVLEYIETDLEEPSEIPETSSTEAVNSQNICTTPSEVQDRKDTSDDLHHYMESAGESQELCSDSVLKKDESNFPSESSEEEQFLFSDLEELELGKVQLMDSGSSDSVNKGDDPAFCAAGSKEVNGSDNTNDESCSSPDIFGQYYSLNDLQNSAEKLRVMSSPISIQRSHMDAEEVGRLAESLPNMRSPSVKLGVHDCHRFLGHSLDSNSKSLKWTVFKENDPSCLKSDADIEQHLAEERPNVEDAQISQEQKCFLSNPAVEISLCKHLLYEGMGAPAASQAFDAEKLDIDKFTTLGPAVLKNDRLVVRILGCYFPWDVAAPIVLGMVAFGIKELFESRGMIAVDCVPAEAIASPSGSWKLWPFSFRRSRSGKAMLPALSDTKSSDAEVASESINDCDGTKSACKPKVVKNMIKALTPTSEQLASLNLKEGRNTVTFTFSTAMLGKQQVDARIYLWKWNTRVVISDVDGTITKSDVLGQFMPLVGMDWSQTGVAHLFSAIKENGYQLLFLSARAISQAYHTRQFLFNLKQDGKALPDGPVVISPDGLFPSLFREVIRRAPHEFKISCLEDIKALFPSDCNPFYAGFGNRDTDEISYLKVGIPRGKIFTINPKGEVAVNRRVDTKSYSSLHTLVHRMFPPTNSSEQEDFNSWNFWKLPPPNIDV